MRTCLLWTLAGFCSLAVQAQYPVTRTFELRIGQQRPKITCLTQDALGLMWVGSDIGVMRSDGERTDLVFRSEVPTTSITTSGNAVIAAFSDGRIVRCDGLRTEILVSDTLFAHFPAGCMYADGSGRLWVGLYGLGVRLIDKGKQLAITDNEGLPDDHVHAIAAFGTDLVAVATDLGIAICDRSGKVLRTITEGEGLPDNLVTALHSDGLGGVWAGTDRSGVVHISGSGKVVALTADRSQGSVRDVAWTDSMLFVATADNGVVAYALGQSGIATYPPPPQVKNGEGRAQQLLRAQDGSVWWCDGTDRLYRSDPTTLIAPEHEGIDLSHITALCSDGGDRIWFATPDGLFEHKASFPDAEKLTRLELPRDARTPIVSLHSDHFGGLWVGTLGMGVFHFHPGSHTLQRFTVKDGLSNDNVLAIRSRQVRQSAEVWFATLGGSCVFRYDLDPPHGGKFTTVELPGNGFQYDILPMPDGNVFVATDGAGVVRIAPDGSTKVLQADHVKTLYSLCADPDGTVWACGPGTGLCRIGPLGIECYGKKVPPFDGNVFAIAAFAGRIVALGESGLAVLDTLGTGIVDLSHEHGLAGVQAELNAACIDGHGALWLATDRGLARLRPSGSALDAAVPTVITTLRWGNELLSTAGVAELRHDQNFITIQFAGLHYSAPEHIRFQYRLAGFDEDIRTTRDREVTWSRLPPGKYRFDVRAALGNNTMPEHWTSLSFTILRPWWLQWWALTLAMLLAIAVVLLLMRMRDNRMRYHDRMEKEKARFHLEALRSQVNPHFLFNSFNTLINLIEEDKDKAVEHTEQLSDFFRNILHVRDKDLIPLREELPLLLTYFSLEKRRFGDRIALQVRIPEDELDRCIPPLTLQLLVENAIKHNIAEHERPLVVEITAEDGVLHVKNAYRPRATASEGTGYGLESIRQRYEMLTDRPVLLEVTQNVFEVRIPLIENRP
ncbi:MAG: histidine kinase [Flavobacteriales bacterium]